MTSNVLRCVDMVPFVAKYFDGKLEEMATKETLTGETGFLGSNEELIACACRAKNGLKFDALYNRGEWENIYPSKSEARAALYEFLTFYCGPNRERVEGLYVESALFDEKWIDRPDEQERLYTKAVAYCNGKYYEGRPADQAEAAPSIFASLSLADLSVGALLETEPEPLRFCAGSLPAGVVGLLGADAGRGKSTIAHQLATEVAGLPATDGLFPAHEIGKVLAVFGEDPRGAIHHRMRAISDAFGDTWEPEQHADAKALLAKNLHILPGAGHDLRLVTFDRHGNATPTRAYEDLRRLCGSIDGLKLFVVDPVSRCFFGNEIDAGQTTHFISLLEKICVETGAACLLIHHFNKQSGAEGKDQLSQHSFRGSTGVVAAARWACALTKLKPADVKKIGANANHVGGYLAGEVVKQNIGAPTPRFYLSREHGGVLRKINAQQTPEAQALEKEIVARALAKIREDPKPWARGEFIKSLSAQLKPDLPKVTRAAVEVAIIAATRDGRLFEVEGPAANRKATRLLQIGEGARDED